jgi:hypothetical protein
MLQRRQSSAAVANMFDRVIRLPQRDQQAACEQGVVFYHQYSQVVPRLVRLIMDIPQKNAIIPYFERFCRDNSE